MTFRLPRHIIPSEYAAEMIPFIEEGNFTIAGHVDMAFSFSEVLQRFLIPLIQSGRQFLNISEDTM